MKLPSGHLYGDILKSHFTNGFALIETSYAQKLKLPAHSHECAYFCFVLQGSYTEVYGKQTRICKPLTLIIHPPDEIHSDHFHNAGGRCLNVQVEPWCLDYVREYSTILDRPNKFYGGMLRSLTLRLYKEFREMGEAFPLALEGLAYEILAEASRRPVRGLEHRPPYWLERAREILHAHFSTGLTLVWTAESVGVHPVHLARTFRQHYGLTVGEYVRRLRIESACRELSTSDCPLVEVASAAGFSSQSHFTTTFKRYTGLTPAQYRVMSRLR